MRYLLIPLLALDFQNLEYNHLYERANVSQVELDFPIVVEIIEEMMLSRYHLTSDDKRWSKDVLSFLSCSLSGSLESLIKVRSCIRFLEEAANRNSIASETSLYLQGD
jgi:hypothetical protein